MRIPESELIINGDGTVFHLHLRPEELADNILLVGDPGRVAMAAQFLTDIEYRRESREFVATTGKCNGKRITVLSTGIGCDNCDIVVNELDALANIDFATREVKAEKKSLNILRVGTSGAIQPEIPLGSYVFSEISIGMDGLLNWYADRDKISLAEYEKALYEQVNWSEHLPHPYFVPAGERMKAAFEGCSIMGMTIAASGFYGPQGRVLRVPLALPNMVAEFEAYRCNGKKITNFEMEGSAIAGLSRQLGHNAGTICCIIAQRHAQDSNPDYKPLVLDLLKLAIQKLSEL